MCRFFNLVQLTLKVKALDRHIPKREWSAAFDFAQDFAGEEYGVVDNSLELGRGSNGFAAKTDGSDDRSGNDEDGVLTTLFHAGRVGEEITKVNKSNYQSAIVVWSTSLTSHAWSRPCRIAFFIASGLHFAGVRQPQRRGRSRAAKDSQARERPLLV